MQGRCVIAHCVTEYRGRPYMEAHLLWLIVGIVLIAAELATGTFYLLFLGLAALVAAAVAFLATPAAGYINGINVPVDGGRLGTL